jgi:hypothetical protein
MEEGKAVVGAASKVNNPSESELRSSVRVVGGAYS